MTTVNFDNQCYSCKCDACFIFSMLWFITWPTFLVGHGFISKFNSDIKVTLQCQRLYCLLLLNSFSSLFGVIFAKQLYTLSGLYSYFPPIVYL